MAFSAIKNVIFSGRNIFQPAAFRCEHLSTALSLAAKSDNETIRGKWLSYNDKVYEPQKPDEEPRPAVSKKNYIYKYFFSLIN